MSPKVKYVFLGYAALSGLAVLFVLGAWAYATWEEQTTAGDFINLHLERIPVLAGLTLLAAVAGIGLLGSGLSGVAALAREDLRPMLLWSLGLGALSLAELVGAALFWWAYA